MKEMYDISLSAREIICLNSIAGGGEIPGIKLYRPLCMNETEYVEETVTMMREKGLVEKENRLTADGKLLLRVLQAYKRCDTYIEIDNVRIGLQKDGRSCVYVRKEKGRYWMFFHDRAILMGQLVLLYPFLKQGETYSDHEPKRFNTTMEMNTFLQEEYPESEQRLEIRKYREKKEMCHLWLCKKDKELYCWDLLKKKGAPIDTEKGKEILWDIFELEEK